MTYKIKRVEDKSADWKVIDLEMGDNSYMIGVSVNRVNKKGEVFPNFDEIKTGATVEGELWASPAGKQYLFAPKPKLQRPAFMGNKTAQMEKVMERKEVAIEHAQERKQDAIQRAGAFRDATILTAEWTKSQPFPTEDEIKAYWVSWVKYFLGKADEPFL